MLIFCIFQLSCYLTSTGIMIPQNPDRFWLGHHFPSLLCDKCKQQPQKVRKNVLPLIFPTVRKQKFWVFPIEILPHLYWDHDIPDPCQILTLPSIPPFSSTNDKCKQPQQRKVKNVLPLIFYVVCRQIFWIFQLNCYVTSTGIMVSQPIDRF